MRRREFIAGLGGVAAWPIVARAQQTKAVSRTIGSLTVGSAGHPFEQAFRQGLRDFGYVEGRNLVIEFRGADGRADRLTGLAAELVSLKADVFFASGSQATSALLQQNTGIPIVTVSTNPVGLGFAESLARPGDNITGVSMEAPEASGKRLQLLKELVPGLAKVAVFQNPNDPGAAFSLQESRAAAALLAIKLQVLETPDVDAFAGAFAAATGDAAQAVIPLPAPLMSRNAERIAQLALQSRLPTIYYSDDFPKAGGLASYGASITAMHRRAAYFVDRILKGAKPAELPVEQPTKFEFVINLKAAKALGLTIPETLLATADEVIQ
jgi:putative ABC transport system substrate-binding protein